MPPPRLKVILLHGTFAGDVTESGPAWWQTQGQFRARLAQVPNVEVAAFHWDIGPNSEAARRWHATRLRDEILAMERSGVAYAFVAHSHGGSVLWHALAEANTVQPGLPGLVRWVTVGTPFLQASPDWFALGSALPLAAGGWGLWNFFRLHANNYWLLRHDFLLNFEPWLHLPVLAMLLALLLTALMAGLHFARSAYGVFQQLRQQRRQSLAYAQVGHRQRIVTALEDEAVSALSLTLAFDGAILPRAGVVAPFSRVLDRLLWLRASRAAQGSDIPGVIISRVSASPVESPQPNFLPHGCNEELIAYAARNFGSTSSSLRKSLRKAVFQEPVQQIGDLLSKVDITEGLIHNSYFREPGTCAAICTALLDEAEAESDTQAAMVSHSKGQLLRVSFVLVVCALLITATLAVDQLLRPLDIWQMALQEIPESGMGDAAASDPTEAFEMFRSMAIRDHGASMAAAAALQSELDRATATSYIAAGLFESGNAVNGNAERVALPVIAPTLRVGEFGPPKMESYFDFATFRLHGRAGDWSAAERRWHKLFPESSGLSSSGSIRHFGYGLVEGGHEALLLKWFPIADYSNQLAVWSRWMDKGKANCGTIAAIAENAAYNQDAQVTVAAAAQEARCKPAELVIQRQSRAVPRLRAAALIALAEAPPPNARELLHGALRDFDQLPQPATESIAEAKVMAASALLALGQAEAARSLLLRIEKLPRQTDGLHTFDDYTPPDRALLWARLGDCLNE